MNKNKLSTKYKRNETKKKKQIKNIIIKWIIGSSISTILIAYFILAIFPTLPIKQGIMTKMQAYALASKKIAYKAFFKKDAIIEGETAHEIVSKIVQERTKNNYLYTGGHYTDFYIRNLGTFANKLIEPQAAKTAEEWLERVKLMVRSTELALSVFESYNEITTTIVQLKNGKYVPINVYVEPSDSLPSLLRILYQLQNIDQMPHTFELTNEEKKEIQIIKNQAQTILKQHETFLKKETNKFIQKYTDEDGFIKRNIALSGIKDSWIRHSSLYDNIMLWSIHEYTSKLNLDPRGKEEADNLKSALLKHRWSEKYGFFYDEDPPSACVKNKKNKTCIPYFSADNHISVEMGMLKPEISEEREYLKRIITYIQNKNLDQPFPLKTTEIRIPSKEHLPVRLFAPNYTGTTIWSYWGMIYIDILHQIGTIENNQEYKEKAREKLNKYKHQIEKYQGFPELYNTDGTEYRKLFYRSVNDMVWGIYYLYLENKLSTAETNS